MVFFYEFKSFSGDQTVQVLEHQLFADDSKGPFAVITREGAAIISPILTF
jgi:hypothetical protein